MADKITYRIRFVHGSKENRWMVVKVVLTDQGQERIIDLVWFRTRPEAEHALKIMSKVKP